MQTLKTIVLVLTAVLATAAVLQNTELVETRLFWFAFETPQAVLLLATMAVGFVLGVIVTHRLGRTPKSKTKAEDKRAEKTPASESPKM